MKLTWRDAVATLLFAVIAVTYAAYLYFGGFTLFNMGVGILDPTGMAGLGLIVGIVAAVVGGWITFGEGVFATYATAVVGLITAALGVLALFGENLFNNAGVWETVLGGFIAGIVLLWGYAVARHWGIVGGERPHAAGLAA
jgi:hypothetical protein